MKSRFSTRLSTLSAALMLAGSLNAVQAETLTILHIGDQESWLVSAQGNLRDDPTQIISYYGGIDRLATVVANRKAAAAAAGQTVLTLNAGDSFLPGLRLNASFANLANAHPDGGQDFYDAIANRLIGIDATTFGNHEFDLDNTGPVAARFAEVSGSTYLSVNLDFSVTPQLANLAAQGKVAASKIFTTAGGKKVAVIGVTTPLLPGISSPPAGIMKNWSASNTELQNLQGLLPLVQAEIDDLRNNQGVSAIVVMSHLQNAQNERTVLIPGLSGVDLVISGGGHELMTDPDDLLVDGGVAPTFVTHPIQATDAAGKSVPLVTGHFGNRYVGELQLDIDDSTGAVKGVLGSKMIRVSGQLAAVGNPVNPADPDAVSGDATINAQVVQPVRAYIQQLNAQIIGTTALTIDGARRAGCTIPAGQSSCVYSAGIRNGDTNAGWLVADALRFAGRTDIAIQNSGGIRASVTGPGNVTEGDTFNVLQFTNLLKIAPAISPVQLKDVLEHAISGSTPQGLEQGRYPQIAGMRVEYDTTQTARPNVAGNVGSAVGQGNRVRRVVLDDGTVLIDNGVVVSSRNVSLATIDFMAAGGDNYPFPANNVVFENSVNTILYQEALSLYLRTPKAQGGLQRDNAADGDEVTANAYPVVNMRDRHGRLIDLAIAQPTPGSVINGTVGRDTLVGTSGDDVITGGAGVDLITGGTGGDTFRYTSTRDAGDTINDFTPYTDKLDLSALLASLGVVGNGVAGGHVRFADVIGGVQVLIDTDGSASPVSARPLVTLKGLTAAQMAPGRDLIGNTAP